MSGTGFWARWPKKQANFVFQRVVSCHWMRIFFSHSTRDKPLVREIRRHLPSHITTWLDEEELLFGDEIEKSIRSAITDTSDFVVVFVGRESVRSPWVRRELKWALERERQTGFIFVLPILLDKESWEAKRLKPARTGGTVPFVVGCRGEPLRSSGTAKAQYSLQIPDELRERDS